MLMGELLRSMGDVFDECGATLILVHHVKSTIADPFRPTELGDIAWAGFKEWAAQWLLLSRREPYEPGTGVHELFMSVGGRLGHTGLHAVDIDEGEFEQGTERGWDVSVRKPDEVRGEAHNRRREAKEEKDRLDSEAYQAKVVEVLVKHSSGLTKRGIRDRTGIGGPKVDAALAALLDSEDVEEIKVQVGNQKTPRVGYRISAKGMEL